MPIISIKTMKGALDDEQKMKIHSKIADVMVETEGKGNEEFRKYVLVSIEEEEPVNFSVGGRAASVEFVRQITRSPNS